MRFQSLSGLLLFFALSLALFSTTAQADHLGDCSDKPPAPISLSGVNDEIDIAGAASVLVNPGGKADYAAIRTQGAGAFHRNCGSYFDGVDSPSALWIRLSVNRPENAPDTWVITVNDPELRQLGLYQTFPDGWVEARHSGRGVDPDTRDFATLQPAVTVRLPNPGPQDIHLRLAGTLAPFLTARLMPDRTYLQEESIDLVALTGITGFLAAMLIINLVLYLRTRLQHFVF